MNEMVKVWLVEVYVRDNKDREEGEIVHIMEGCCNRVEQDSNLTFGFEVIEQNENRR